MIKRQNGAIKAMQKRAAERNEKLAGGRFWRILDLVISLLSVAVLVIAIRATLVEPVRVQGSSMLDTLQENDYLFVEKLTYAFTTPKVGDIVICYYPDAYYEANQKAYRTRVKRVVAVEGDVVETKGGLLYVNGEAVDEPYLSEQRSNTDRIETPVTVGKGEVYVLGDNRVNSNDSRNGLVGAIPLERIVGKAHFVVFPFKHWHTV